MPKAPDTASASLYGHDDVKFSWAKAEGASGYFVYYKKSTSKEYTYFKRTTATSINFTNLSDGVKYNFKVVPYKLVDDVRYASLQSKVTSVTTKKLPAAPASVSATLYGYDDVKFSWSKVTGASGYHVYYKKSTSSNYTYYGKTTATSLKFANLTDGVKYNFKVIPYVKVGDVRNYSTSSAKVASVYTLKKISTPTVTKSASKVKITWKDTDGESGYQYQQLQMSNGKCYASGSYTTRATSATLSAPTGKVRYYRVRPYKKVGTTYVYGPWSEMKAYTYK